MSALGQKQTCAVQNGMSALHPKADMCGALVNVRFVPIADIEHVKRKTASRRSFRNLIQLRPLLPSGLNNRSSDNFIEQYRYFRFTTSAAKSHRMKLGRVIVR